MISILKNLDGLFAFELGCLAQEQGVILQYYGILSWVSNLKLFDCVCALMSSAKMHFKGLTAALFGIYIIISNFLM